MDDFKSIFDRDLTEYQSIPFWSWNDELKEDELRRQIRAMKAAGIGGFFMHARGGLTTPYLGEEWMKLTGACIDEARAQGMDAWCYDENGWPSGFAGMKLLEDPANWEHYITCETRDAFDPAALAVYALEGTNLKRLHGPEAGVREYITVYEKKNSSVVDILDPAIVRKFLDETHEKYYARFGADFGTVMKGFFTDEPQFFRWDTAYTPVMLKAYRDAWGEDLLDGLGALFVDCDQANRFRFRYWSTMNKLYTESFAKQIYDWCEAHHCQLTGHSIEESSLFGQMMCCAGIMPFYEYEHKPGVDWLGRGIRSEMTPRQVSSVAQQLGKKHVLTETFACAGWDVTPTELKRIAEWQYVSGVNQMCQHLYPYSIRGQRKRDYPAFYSEHNTWTRGEDFRRFNDAFTALGYMLAESDEVAPVAVIHPIHSAYLTFKRRDEHSCDALNAAFEQLIESLGAAGIGHHYVDETLLKKYGRVEGDALIVGKCRYTAVVIPDMPGLDKNTADMLREYQSNGGRVYLQGQTPHLVDGEKADLTWLKANIAFDDLISAEYGIDRRDTAVRMTCRKGAFGTFLYAVNLSKDTAYDVTLRLKAGGARLFDLQTREMRQAYFLLTEGGVSLPMTLKPGDSVVIMADDAAESAPAPRKVAAWTAQPLEAEVTGADENTLTLDMVSVSFDGKAWQGPMFVMAASDMLLRGKKDRTVYLKYAFELTETPDSLRLEREDMFARAAWLNGEPIAFPDKGTFDPAFVSADILSRARLGLNELVLELDYHQTRQVYDVFNGVYYEHSDGTESLINCLSYVTDIEAVYLRGHFGVRGAFEAVPGGTLKARGPFAIGRQTIKLRADSLAASGYGFFCGDMTLRMTLNARGDESKLRLRGRYALARVTLGGVTRTLMFGDELDISGLLKPGENELLLTLCLSPRNTFGPHHFSREPEPMAVGPDLFSRYGTWREGGVSDLFTPDYQFVFAGLSAVELG